MKGEEVALRLVVEELMILLAGSLSKEDQVELRVSPTGAVDTPVSLVVAQGSRTDLKLDSTLVLVSTMGDRVTTVEVHSVEALSVVVHMGAEATVGMMVRVVVKETAMEMVGGRMTYRVECRGYVAEVGRVFRGGRGQQNHAFGTGNPIVQQNPTL